MGWSVERPKEPGWYWVWQPEEIWPCRGTVYCVLVERDALDWQGLCAWVPGMDYSDPVAGVEADNDTWIDSWWIGPIDQPTPPEGA